MDMHKAHKFIQSQVHIFVDVQTISYKLVMCAYVPVQSYIVHTVGS